MIVVKIQVCLEILFTGINGQCTFIDYRHSDRNAKDGLVSLGTLVKC